MTRSPAPLAPLAPLALAMALAAATTACEPQNRASLHPSFGNAVSHNMAMQVVNPTPERVTLPPEHGGARSAIATHRYNTATTTPLETVNTRSQDSK